MICVQVFKNYSNVFVDRCCTSQIIADQLLIGFPALGLRILLTWNQCFPSVIGATNHALGQYFERPAGNSRVFGSCLAHQGLRLIKYDSIKEILVPGRILPGLVGRLVMQKHGKWLIIRSRAQPSQSLFSK